MFISGIKKLFFLSAAIIFSLFARAQQSHFIYLQTDNGLPFYAKFQGKLVSSSAEGYIILPGVVDGDYQLSVGFPKNEIPEETFKINIDKNNEGYLIKNFDEKGLQLFNLQTLALIDGTGKDTATVATAKDADPFSVALAGAVKDSSILQNHEGPGVTAAAAPAVVGAAAVAANIPSKKDSRSEVEPVGHSAMVAGDSVSKIMSGQTDEGLQMVYEDKTDSSVDTVRVLIPVEKKQPDSGEVNNTAAQNYQPAKDITPSAAAPAVVASGVIAVNSANPSTGSQGTNPKPEAGINNGIKEPTSGDTTAKGNEIAKADTAAHNLSETQVIVLPKAVTSSKNSDCKDFATDNDFLKLRSKMAEESENAKMIQTATKYFRKKCYSTAQIKNLSYIFLTDEGKYQFLEAAYPFVSDADQYPELGKQFTDSYYLNRFKALVSK